MKSPAIQFIEPKIGEDGRIFGIDVAVRTLLHAFFRHSHHETFYCRTRDQHAFAAFRAEMTHVGADPARCRFLAEDDLAGLENVSVLFRPDPNINGHVSARATMDPASHAICGLSHTMSSMQVMSTVAVAMALPLQSWDAIVCPSTSIRSVVESLWEAAGQGAALPPAQLPVIPLGIDTEKFTAAVSPAKRADQRRALGVSEDDTVILFYGRLSYHNKAHPLPLMLAAEQLAVERLAAGHQGTGNVHLVFYGYFTGDTFRDDYQNAAADICQSAKVQFIENTDARFPDGLWAGADIFTSLVDNIQESFGLTPIEAMASGLPAVVSDWDGYRNTVRHGEDGYLIPTLAPPPGSGHELVRRYLAGEDVYGEYLAGAGQSVAVDVDATVDALRNLIANPALRAEMAAAGRQRAREVFDWAAVIPAYEDLWAELAARRRSDAPTGPAAQNAITGPRELDPYSVFRDFPSTTLSPRDHIELTARAAEALAQRLRHRMNLFAPIHLIEIESLPKLLSTLQRTNSVGEILAQWPEESRNALLLTLVWLVKMGVARHHPAETTAGA